MTLKPAQPVMTTSWDDGHPLDMRLAELLSKYELPGTFYIPLENPMRPVMDQASIQTLGAVFDIGAHTVHHAEVEGLSDADAAVEISAPKKILEDLTGKPCKIFCFPRGKYKRSQLRFVREAGFLGARTVELMSLEWPRQQDGILVMPTTMHAYEHSAMDYLRNFGKRMMFVNLMNYVRSPKKDWVTASEWFLAEAIRTNSVFHLWGHSWEIEKFNLWEQLETVFLMMSQEKGAAVRADNSQICEMILGQRETENPAGPRPLSTVRR